MSFPFTLTSLTQALQDWPVAYAAGYVANIPNCIGLGELKLLRDLNLEIFDVTDQSFTLAGGAAVVTKPANLVSLRTMQLALISSTTTVAANATAIGASQATFQSTTSITFNGTLGANPVTVSVPAQFTVTDTTSGQTGGGVLVTVQGLDYLGDAQTEFITSVNGQTVSGLTRWSLIIFVNVSDGSAAQTLSYGLAAVSSSTLGNKFPVFKRNYDYVTNYASTAGVTARPRYYAEMDSNTWILSQAADQSYAVVVRFIKRPQSLVTINGGVTWLSANCGDLLFHACLLEAENFLKADDRYADIEGQYNTKLQIARMELRNSIREGDYSPVKPAAAPAQG
jgi:hypothetical protein